MKGRGDGSNRRMVHASAGFPTASQPPTAPSNLLNSDPLPRPPLRPALENRRDDALVDAHGVYLRVCRGPVRFAD